MTDIFDIAGRSILVAGGAGGIGSGIAAELARRGAKLTVADVNEDAARAACDGLSGEGHAACRLNVTDEASCSAAVEAAIANGGRLDGMLNAAGILRVASAIELAEADFQASMDINVTGSLLLARQAGKVMIEQGGGQIVTIASVSSIVANPNYAAYATSKAALMQLTRVLAVEWAEHQIAVNAIGPAVIPTPLSDPFMEKPEFKAYQMSRIPMGRMATVDDLFGAAMLLLSPAGAFITGQTIYVDGGRTLV
jgi:NAD(P)-dependent dehydrogenase (short-subunit alcohol dehydrogenase family)